MGSLPIHISHNGAIHVHLTLALVSLLDVVVFESKK